MTRHGRRYPRYEVKNIDGTFLFDLEVNVLNLSLGGMAVETPHRLKVGRRYSFKIQHGGESINVSGTVAWSTLRGTCRTCDEDVRPIYHAGVCFEDVLTNKAREIRDLIEENVILDVPKRVLGRFQLGPETAVTVSSHVDFEVQKISLAGMLVETPLLAELDSIFPIEISLANGLLTATGRIAYIRPYNEDCEPESYWLGVEFREVDEDNRQRLEDYITFWVESEQSETDPDEELIAPPLG